jgi:hypothetical protein
MEFWNSRNGQIAPAASPHRRSCSASSAALCGMRDCTRAKSPGGGGLTAFFRTQLPSRYDPCARSRALTQLDRIQPDGICGTKTIAAILWCQKSENYWYKGGFKTGAEDSTINHADNVIYGPNGNALFYSMWNIQNHLQSRNALPHTAAEITVQPLGSELEKYFKMGLVPKI